MAAADPLDRVFPPEQCDEAVGAFYVEKGYVQVDGIVMPGQDPQALVAAYQHAMEQAQ